MSTRADENTVLTGGSVAEGDGRVAALCVLGSISINIDSQPVPVGGEKPRRLLAMLIVNRNAVVSADRLMQVIWGDDVPDTVLPTLQSYVSRLRRLLPPAVRLVNEAPGYRLVVDAGTTDIDRFETALGEGLASLERAPAATVARLDEALAEWRGDALAEFADEWWAQAEATRLGELRLHARETRVTALLALGLDERAASEAEAITVDHPWREQPWRQMLLALHRAGRQGDALRKASEYRARLRDGLGLDPSTEFVSLERDVATNAAHLRVAPAPAGPPDVVHLDSEGVRLIGREEDLTNVVALCEHRRLVTLLGPGGIGKTQLALAAAASLVTSKGFRSEVVELARVRDEQGVVAAVATQLGVQTQQGRSVTESVFDLLGRRALLLVLDNCEHVLDTIAGFVEQLLRLCPEVWVLATSREPLARPVETVYKVPPLPVAAEGFAFGDTAASPAVVLFLDRARAANSDFVADESTTRAVADLCRRLDGIPLAIELAAARTRSLSPTEIAERLGDRFGLLAGSSRVSDQRHRSLKDLVDWSYQLLDPAAQQLFRRLSTFAGSFDLDAVEQVCAYAQVSRESIASLLGSLVDKSMVQAFSGTRTTYRLLETLREYGAALAETEGPELARRHGAWIVGICERGAAGLHGADERAWLDLFDGLFDDLRLAVRNALNVDDLGTALRIVVAAREHAFRRLRYELIGWAEAALARDGAAAQPLAAAAWGLVAYGRFVRGEIDAAIDLGQRSMELARQDGTDTFGLAERALANAWVFLGDTDSSRSAMLQLVDGAVASGDEARIAHAYYMRSLSETSTARTDAGIVYAERDATAAAQCRNPTAQAQAAYATGIWLATTQPARAREQLQRSEALSSAVGNLWFELFARTETLWLRAFDGQPRDVLSGFADVISAWHRAGDWANQWLSLRHVLGICHLLGADELAVTIHGALERAGAVNAFPFEPAAAANLSKVVDELRSRMGDERFRAAEQQGRLGATSIVIDRIVAELRSLSAAG
jgi:predicted ATPase/DNA-binding SARP family transcriptional activator